MTLFEAICELNDLKAQLSATDHKIVENVEYKAIGKKVPYDPAEIHNERQALRDRISELEELIPTLTGGIC